MQASAGATFARWCPHRSRVPSRPRRDQIASALQPATGGGSRCQVVGRACAILVGGCCDRAARERSAQPSARAGQPHKPSRRLERPGLRKRRYSSQGASSCGLLLLRALPATISLCQLPGDRKSVRPRRPARRCLPSVRTPGPIGPLGKTTKSRNPLNWAGFVEYRGQD
jgi:hypothetical protein